MKWNFSPISTLLLSGTPAVIRPTPARCYGDEKRHHITCGGTVSQDLHTEARKRQVRYDNIFITCRVLLFTWKIRRSGRISRRKYGILHNAGRILPFGEQKNVYLHVLCIFSEFTSSAWCTRARGKLFEGFPEEMYRVFRITCPNL